MPKEIPHSVKMAIRLLRLLTSDKMEIILNHPDGGFELDTPGKDLLMDIGVVYANHHELTADDLRDILSQEKIRAERSLYEN